MRKRKSLFAILSFALVALFSLPSAVRPASKSLEVRDVFAGSAKGEKIVKRANEEPEFAANGLISDVKVQISGEEDGTRNIRFVAAIDSTNYTSATFDYVVKENGVEKASKSVSVTRVYTAILANSEEVSPKTFGEEYNYFLAYAIMGVPSQAYDWTFEVSVSIANDEISNTTAVKTTSVQDIIDIENPPMEQKELVLHPTDPWGDWGPYKIQWSTTFGFTYSDLIASGEAINEVVQVTIVKDGITYHPTVTGDNGTYAITGQFNGVPNTKVGVLEVTISIIYQRTIYTATFFVLDGVVTKLENYKASAVANINQFVQDNAMVEIKYGANWPEFQDVLQAGIDAINSAVDFAGVDDEVEATKLALLAVEIPKLDLTEAINVAKAEINLRIASDYQSAWYSAANWNDLNNGWLSLFDNLETEEDLDDAKIAAYAYIASIPTEVMHLTNYGEVNTKPGGQDGTNVLIAWNAQLGLPKYTDAPSEMVLDITISYNDEEYKPATAVAQWGGVLLSAPSAFTEKYGKLGLATSTVEIVITYKNRTYVSTIRFRNQQRVVNVSDEINNRIPEVDSFIASEAIVASKYTSENWTLLQNIKADGIARMRTATTFQELDHFYVLVTQEILAVEQKEVNDDEGLRTLALVALDSAIQKLHQNWYSPADWEMIQTIGHVEIAAASGADDINAARDAALAAISTVEKTYKEITIHSAQEVSGNWCKIWMYGQGITNSTTAGIKIKTTVVKGGVTYVTTERGGENDSVTLSVGEQSVNGVLIAGASLPGTNFAGDYTMYVEFEGTDHFLYRSNVVNVVGGKFNFA